MNFRLPIAGCLTSVFVACSDPGQHQRFPSPRQWKSETARAACDRFKLNRDLELTGEGVYNLISCLSDQRTGEETLQHSLQLLEAVGPVGLQRSIDFFFQNGPEGSPFQYPFLVHGITALDRGRTHRDLSAHDQLTERQSILQEFLKASDLHDIGKFLFGFARVDKSILRNLLSQIDDLIQALPTDYTSAFFNRLTSDATMRKQLIELMDVVVSDPQLYQALSRFLSVNGPQATLPRDSWRSCLAAHRDISYDGQQSLAACLAEVKPEQGPSGLQIWQSLQNKLPQATMTKVLDFVLNTILPWDRQTKHRRLWQISQLINQMIRAQEQGIPHLLATLNLVVLEDIQTSELKELIDALDVFFKEGNRQIILPYLANKYEANFLRLKLEHQMMHGDTIIGCQGWQQPGLVEAWSKPDAVERVKSILQSYFTPSPQCDGMSPLVAKIKDIYSLEPDEICPESSFCQWQSPHLSTPAPSNILKPFVMDVVDTTTAALKKDSYFLWNRRIAGGPITLTQWQVLTEKLDQLENFDAANLVAVDRWFMATPAMQGKLLQPVLETLMSLAIEERQAFFHSFKALDQGVEGEQKVYRLLAGAYMNGPWERRIQAYLQQQLAEADPLPFQQSDAAHAVSQLRWRFSQPGNVFVDLKRQFGGSFNQKFIGSSSLYQKIKSRESLLKWYRPSTRKARPKALDLAALISASSGWGQWDFLLNYRSYGLFQSPKNNALLAKDAPKPRSTDLGQWLQSQSNLQPPDYVSGEKPLFKNQQLISALLQPQPPPSLYGFHRTQTWDPHLFRRMIFFHAKHFVFTPQLASDDLISDTEVKLRGLSALSSNEVEGGFWHFFMETFPQAWDQPGEIKQLVAESLSAFPLDLLNQPLSTTAKTMQLSLADQDDRQRRQYLSRAFVDKPYMGVLAFVDLLQELPSAPDHFRPALWGQDQASADGVVADRLVFTDQSLERVYRQHISAYFCPFVTPGLAYDAATVNQIMAITGWQNDPETEQICQRFIKTAGANLYAALPDHLPLQPKWVGQQILSDILAYGAKPELDERLVSLPLRMRITRLKRENAPPERLAEIFDAFVPLMDREVAMAHDRQVRNQLFWLGQPGMFEQITFAAKPFFQFTIDDDVCAVHGSICELIDDLIATAKIGVVENRSLMATVLQMVHVINRKPEVRQAFVGMIPFLRDGETAEIFSEQLPYLFEPLGHIDWQMPHYQVLKQLMSHAYLGVLSHSIALASVEELDSLAEWVAGFLEVLGDENQQAESLRQILLSLNESARQVSRSEQPQILGWQNDVEYLWQRRYPDKFLDLMSDLWQVMTDTNENMHGDKVQPLISVKSELASWGVHSAVPMLSNLSAHSRLLNHNAGPLGVNFTMLKDVHDILQFKDLQGWEAVNILFKDPLFGITTGSWNHCLSHRLCRNRLIDLVHVFGQLDAKVVYYGLQDWSSLVPDLTGMLTLLRDKAEWRPNVEQDYRYAIGTLEKISQGGDTTLERWMNVLHQWFFDE